MDFFNFHHHKKNFPGGIYNVPLFESVPDHFYSVGIHPKDINEKNIHQQFEWLKHAITGKCIAIGECGLDSLVQANAEMQEKVFLQQVNIAHEFRKPLIIHCVRKFPELIRFRKKTDCAMVVHGFNKKQNIADSLLANNFHLSFGKAALYNLSLQNTLKNTPLDKIFLETDDDDFDVALLYQKVCEIKKISIENLKNQIFINLEAIKNG